MADLIIGFTEEESSALRERAAAQGVSVASFAHDAVIAAIDEQSRLFDKAADHVLRVSGELNLRLA